MNDLELVRAAIAARENSYSPYSNFAVGAALDVFLWHVPAPWGMERSIMNDLELVRAAIAARENSYSPYSNFAVGAALLCADGTVYGGCNIENAAYSPGNCAERTAFFRAIFDGHRDFTAIAVVAGAISKTRPIRRAIAPSARRFSAPSSTGIGTSRPSPWSGVPQVSPSASCARHAAYAGR